VACVFFKPPVKESRDIDVARTAGTRSMLLDGFAKRISRHLSCIKAALGDLV